MMNNINDKIQFKKTINSYLLEIKEFIGTDITPNLLSSREDMEEIRNKSYVLNDLEKLNFVMNFDLRKSKRFKQFIANLDKANNRPVYIWTEKSNVCGLYKASSIKAINFSFKFDVNDDGMVIFLTEDCNDRLLLDFYIDYKERKMLDLEVKGKNWFSVPF